MVIKKKFRKQLEPIIKMDQKSTIKVIKNQPLKVIKNQPKP